MTAAPRTRREITIDALAIGAATGAYGISFGALAVTNGFDAWQAQALSLLMFTGASQFATVAILGAGGTAVAAEPAGSAVADGGVADDEIAAQLQERIEELEAGLVERSVALAAAEEDLAARTKELDMRRNELVAAVSRADSLEAELIDAQASAARTVDTDADADADGGAVAESADADQRAALAEQAAAATRLRTTNELLTAVLAERDLELA